MGERERERERERKEVTEKQSKNLKLIFRQKYLVFTLKFFWYDLKIVALVSSPSSLSSRSITNSLTFSSSASGSNTMGF